MPLGEPDTTTLTMSYGGHDVVFTEGQVWCSDVNVMVDGHQQPPLKGSPELTRQIGSLLGIPATS